MAECDPSDSLSLPGETLSGDCQRGCSTAIRPTESSGQVGEKQNDRDLETVGRPSRK